MCSVCGMQISDKSNYNKHMQSHSDELGYKCTVCSKGFKAKRYLKSHMKIHDKIPALEDKNKKTMQKGVRYWQMLCDKENKMYA